MHPIPPSCFPIYVADWDTLAAKTCIIAISTMHFGRGGGSAIASLLMDVDGDLQVDHYCTKFLERMGLSREVSYPSMPNTAHGLKASIKKLFHNTKIKWYKMVQNGRKW